MAGLAAASGVSACTCPPSDTWAGYGAGGWEGSLLVKEGTSEENAQGLHTATRQAAKSKPTDLVMVARQHEGWLLPGRQLLHHLV